MSRYEWIALFRKIPFFKLRLENYNGILKALFSETRNPPSTFQSSTFIRAYTRSLIHSLMQNIINYLKRNCIELNE